MSQKTAASDRKASRAVVLTQLIVAALSLNASAQPVPTVPAGSAAHDLPSDNPSALFGRQNQIVARDMVTGEETVLLETSAPVVSLVRDREGAMFYTLRIDDSPERCYADTPCHREYEHYYWLADAGSPAQLPEIPLSSGQDSNTGDDFVEVASSVRLDPTGRAFVPTALWHLDARSPGTRYAHYFDATTQAFETAEIPPRADSSRPLERCGERSDRFQLQGDWSSEQSSVVFVDGTGAQRTVLDSPRYPHIDVYPSCVGDSWVISLQDVASSALTMELLVWQEGSEPLSLGEFGGGFDVDPALWTPDLRYLFFRRSDEVDSWTYTGFRGPAQVLGTTQETPPVYLVPAATE